MMTTTTTTSTSSSLTSPIIIPISTAVHVLGKNYDESIVLTSKYNQVIFLVFFLSYQEERVGEKKE